MTTICVVIPVKNDARMLERCLQALAGQSRPADEIIVVDNASADDTAEVAIRGGATVLYELQPGITAAASRGYDAATSEIIARCDADSIVGPDWLARIEALFAKHPDIVAATGPASFYDLKPFGNWLARVFYLDAYFFTVRAATANTPLFGSNFAMRRGIWQSVSASVPRDMPDLHDDFDLSYRIHPDNRILFDRDLRVSISGRPFRDAAAFRRRIKMAGATLRQHGGRDLPHRRWRRRLIRPRASA